MKNSSTWIRKNSKKETLRTVFECRYIYQILTGMNASAYTVTLRTLVPILKLSAICVLLHLFP